VGFEELLQLPTEGLGPVENLGARPLVSEGLTRPQREVLTIALDPPGHPRLGDLYVPSPLDIAAYLGVVGGEVVQTEGLCNTHQHLLIVVGEAGVAVGAGGVLPGAVVRAT